MMEVLATLKEYTVTALVVALFIWQYIENRKYGREREEKLYCIIEELSKQIPDIKTKVLQISEKLDKHVDKCTKCQYIERGK